MLILYLLVFKNKSVKTFVCSDHNAWFSYKVYHAGTGLRHCCSCGICDEHNFTDAVLLYGGYVLLYYWIDNRH